MNQLSETKRFYFLLRFISNTRKMYIMYMINDI